MDYISGWRLYAFEELLSTNDEAKKEYINNIASNVIITTNKQNKGRGRRGRSWIDVSGNLFMSLVISFEMKNLGYLSIISSLSLLETIKNISPDLIVNTKWPNDILVDMKKISGILIEKSEIDNRFIIGIGVNIANSPKDLSSNYYATSLFELGIVISKEQFIKKFLEFFDKNIKNFKEGKLQDIREKWQDNAINLGKDIAIANDDVLTKGKFVGIDENCALIIEEKNGSHKKIYAGDVYN